MCFPSAPGLVTIAQRQQGLHQVLLQKFLQRRYPGTGNLRRFKYEHRNRRLQPQTRSVERIKKSRMGLAKTGNTFS